ncbi:Membrane magnesium transporter 2 [Armadillidium nasatum]|uniref:Membrane magnesium transporter n=1 Tax=Armadillidium nasatum TaxID=96803 RepID=A0A5N5T0I8_9CRUS|nr:Membrane magnesium transporter 2 [Armadillidium nasatum]KAB7506559.1 Membrane magnesium transporter 2 [Armadillidium nasatum]
MGVFVYKIICLIGLFSLLHTGYSAAEYRATLRVIEQEYSSLPSDILLQGLISLIVMMYGVLYSVGDFKEIRATIQLENKSWETAGNRPSFYSFCHRGRNLCATSLTTLKYNKTSLSNDFDSYES